MYKPTYCCDCGEKIERLNWNLLTNGRFCEFCETEHNADILLRKAAIALLSLFGIFGIGSYFVSGVSENDLGQIADSNQSINFKKTPPIENGDEKKLTKQGEEYQSAEQTESVGSIKQPELETGNNYEPRQLKPRNLPAQKVTSEAVYFCGAATKKGTPCSRRVKGGGRCWQHEGKEAILPEKELRINP